MEVLLILAIVLSIVALVFLLQRRTSGYASGSVVKGVCFQFYNDQNPSNGSMYPDFTRDENWNDVRLNDLKIIKAMGASVVRTYEFGFDAKHGRYLSALEQVGLQTAIPVSDYNLTVNDPKTFGFNWLRYLQTELTTPTKQYRPCVHSVMLFNEPELQQVSSQWPSIVCNHMQAILDSEAQFGITGALPLIIVPVSSGTVDSKTGKTGPPGKVYLDQIESQMKAQGLDVKLQGRYVAGVNTTLPPAEVLRQFDTVYGKPYFLTEYGPPGATMSPDTITSYFSGILESPPPNLRGVFAFQYFDPTNKSGDERKFGMTCWASPYDDVPPGDFCAYKDQAHPNSCPPAGTQVGDKNGLIAALAKAFGGADVSKMFGTTCGGGPAPVCLPKQGADPGKLGGDIGWACGQTDCTKNPCTGNPYDAATYVFSKYYSENASKGATCDFGGDATLRTPDSSIKASCLAP